MDIAMHIVLDDQEVYSTNYAHLMRAMRCANCREKYDYVHYEVRVPADPLREPQSLLLCDSCYRSLRESAR